MTIYITGDTHGNIHKRLGVRNFPEQRTFDGSDYIIVLGDFGVIWDQKESKEEKYLLNWLDEKPWTTLFIDGNHENFDRLYSDEFEIVDMFGGKVQKISDKVYHLLRGEFYTIEGHDFFCFGGAASHDTGNLLNPEADPNWKRKRTILNRNYESFRVIGQSWWSQELPSDSEKQYALDILDEHDWKCDYVLTHTPPASTVLEYAKIKGKDYVPDDASVFLEQIKDKLDYKHWFSGHLHARCDVNPKDHIVYRNIIAIE